MSDFILKFWPRDEVKEVKTEKIKTKLNQLKIIGEPTEFWGMPAFNPGQSINEYLEPKLDRTNPYFDTISITVSDKDYGVVQGEEDFEFIDRLNVISIKGGEGAIDKWDKMCEKLKSITGDEYDGGWELL